MGGLVWLFKGFCGGGFVGGYVGCLVLFVWFECFFCRGKGVEWGGEIDAVSPNPRSPTPPPTTATPPPPSCRLLLFINHPMLHPPKYCVQPFEVFEAQSNDSEIRCR